MQSKNVLDKLKYQTDCAAGVCAISSDGERIALKDLRFQDVKFIAGLWRVQNKFTGTIINVRGSDFVIVENLPKQEKNHFQYYRGAIVSENCYGKFMLHGCYKIIAKYETTRGTYWAYGDTLEQARAFLGIKLYDEFSDIIHNVIGKTRQK